MKKVILFMALMFLTFAFAVSAPFAFVKVLAEETNQEDNSTEGTDPFEESFGTRYEAEEGIGKSVEIKGEGTNADYGVYSGTGFVGCIDYPDSAVIFTVTVETDGEYELYIRYATAMTGATLKVIYLPLILRNTALVV